jgi:hypothetical protein
MKNIEERIAESEWGSLFIYSDFADIAPNAAIRKAFSRLEKDGVIRRILRGVYDKPRYIERIKEYAAPDPDRVARKLADKFGWNIAPNGVTALNLLGLSTQVPNAFEYVSDGPYRSYRFGPYELRFVHTANRELNGLSPVSATVIQAIRALGERNITQNSIDYLTNHLTEKDKQLLLTESKRIPVWICSVVQQVATDRGSDA